MMLWYFITLRTNNGFINYGNHVVVSNKLVLSLWNLKTNVIFKKGRLTEFCVVWSRGWGKWRSHSIVLFDGNKWETQLCLAPSVFLCTVTRARRKITCLLVAGLLLSSNSAKNTQIVRLVSLETSKGLLGNETHEFST